MVAPEDPNAYDADEIGPMYRIRFADATEITAWPEEIGADDDALRGVGITPEHYRDSRQH